MNSADQVLNFIQLGEGLTLDKNALGSGMESVLYTRSIFIKHLIQFSHLCS